MNTHTIDPYGRSSQERDDIRRKIDAANKEAADRWDDPAWRREMAQEVTETIYWGFDHENLLGLLTQVENAPFDGRVFVKEVRGLRAHWVARGGYIEASTMRSDVMELPRDMIGFHVFEFEDKIRTSFAETQATLVQLGVQRMDAEVNLRLVKLFQAAVPSSSPYYISGAGVSLATINSAITAVADQSFDGAISIVGRRTMTDQIINAITSNGSFGAFLPQTNEDLLRRGVLGQYRGVNIVTLQNYRDDQDISFFPANELYVVGRDASKFAFWGGLLSKEWTELDNWYWHYIARRDFGGVVHRPQRLRRIVDTSIPSSVNTTPSPE